MPALSGQFNWDAGLVWQVGFNAGTALPAPTRNASDPPHVCPALVDTGASRTCVAKSVVEALGLRPIGRTGMQTADGPVDVNVYDVNVALLTGIAQNPDGTVDVRAEVFCNVRVSEFAADGRGQYQALIGRDILRIGVLTLALDGHYSFSW